MDTENRARERFVELISESNHGNTHDQWPKGACDCRECAENVFDLVVSFLASLENGT